VRSGGRPSRQTYTVCEADGAVGLGVADGAVADGDAATGELVN
jgi:hypothetical protein